jgi:hypothetical protein
MKNAHKNLPQQAQKSPKCCSEHKKPGAFQCFCPTFQKYFLKRDLFDSLNGLRYLPPGVAGKIIVYALLRAKSPTVPAPEAVKCTLC